MPITKYLWDGDNILAETDGSDTVTTVYTNEPQQYGNLISQRSGTTTSYFHFDALGSTRQLTTAAGVVSDTFTYNSWGEEVARTGTTATPFRWIGELGYYWDPERQLYYIRHRSYSGPLGRWLAVDTIPGRFTSRDPIGYPDGFNLYAAYFAPSRVNPTGRSLGGPPNGWPIIPPPGEVPLAGLSSKSRLRCPVVCCEPINCTFQARTYYSRATLSDDNPGDESGIGWFTLILSHQPGTPGGIIGPPPKPNPMRNKVCSSDMGRSPNGQIQIVTDGPPHITCNYTAASFDVNGIYIPGSNPAQCLGIFTQSPFIFTGSPASANGGQLAFTGPFRSVKFDFTIETYCGCGGFDALGVPLDRNSGTLSLSGHLP